MGHDVEVDLALFAEAGSTVGTGHLVEALSIAAEARVAGVRPVVIVPADVPAGLLKHTRVPVEIVPDFAPPSLTAVAGGLVARGARLAVANFRNVSDRQVSALGKAGLRVICVDELGGLHLNCAAVINPSPVPGRHRYTSDVPGFRVYGGLEYLALSSEYARWHPSPRQFAGGIKSLVVSMGGVDRTGATPRIARALRDWRSAAERHVVVGAAFPWGEEIEQLLDGSAGRWRIHRDLPCLADLLALADVGFSAGGNTLCEMACVGTPALVFYEDEHEAEQGRAFEAQGFGRCLGAGTKVGVDSIWRALDQLEDPVVRRAQSEAGRRLVDGRGASRIWQVLAEQLSIDSPFTA